MYEQISKLLLDNGARLIYTVNRQVASTIDKLSSDHRALYGELCLNEKVAYELALTGSYAGKRTACLFTTEGLYEALDPLMSSAYTGVIGGCLLVCVRETDEKVTPLGLFSKLPVIVSETYEEFSRACDFGYAISEKYEIPVIIQTTPEADETVERSPLTVHVFGSELRTPNLQTSQKIPIVGRQPRSSDTSSTRH